MKKNLLFLTINLFFFCLLKGDIISQVSEAFVSDINNRITDLNKKLEQQLEQLKKFQVFFSAHQKEISSLKINNGYGQTIKPKIQTLKQIQVSLDNDINQLEKQWDQMNKEEKLQNSQIYMQLNLAKTTSALIHTIFNSYYFE